MPTVNFFQKIAFIFFALVLLNGRCNLCRCQSANYEAANWKTWLLDNPQQITVVAPPAAAQSKAELQSIKQGIAKLDEKKLTEIKYWDAGAPSYRWNQIVLGLISQKHEV